MFNKVDVIKRYMWNSNIKLTRVYIRLDKSNSSTPNGINKKVCKWEYSGGA